MSPPLEAHRGPQPLSPDLERLQQCTTYVNMLKVAGRGHSSRWGTGWGQSNRGREEAIHQRGCDLFCLDKQTWQ